LFDHHFTEKLAQNATFGMFQSFQQLLMLGYGWECVMDLMPLSSELKQFTALYLHKIKLFGLVEHPMTFVCCGSTSTSLAKRMREHHSDKCAPDDCCFHYHVWTLLGTQDE